MTYDAKREDRKLFLDEERMDLAVEQTREASERTLMAWIRTTLSMISFGFGLFKFLQYNPQFEGSPGPGNAHGPFASQNLGAALIGLGTLFLVMAMVQYANVQKRLRAMSRTKVGFPLVMMAALAISLVGLFALLNVVFRFVES